MNILAISGSLQAGSSNTALLRAASNLTPNSVDVELYRSLAELPHFNADLDGEDVPDAVTSLRAQLQAAHAILFATPEYAHGMPGSLKNLLDWVVGSGELVGKPVAIISASPNSTGGSKARDALDQTLRVMTADVVSSVSVPFVRQKLDEHGKVSDPQTIQELKTIINQLIRHVTLVS